MAGFFIQPEDERGALSDAFVSHEGYEARRAEFDRRAEFHNAGAAAFAALADNLNPPPLPEPWTARDAHSRACEMLFNALGAAADVDAKAEGLASAFMARKVNSGRRAAIARSMSALVREMDEVERMRQDAKCCIGRWAEKPGLPPPLVDLAPHAYASVADTLSLARARIKVACDMRAADTPDMDFMGCMGAASNPDAQPVEHPETAAERAARALAEMLS